LSVAISLKKNLVSPWLISNFFYYGCTSRQVAGNVRFFRKCGGVGVWGCGGVGVGVVSPYVRTFQGLHFVRLWTPTI
jgi:hypothetical protein